MIKTVLISTLLFGASAVAVAASSDAAPSGSASSAPASPLVSAKLSDVDANTGIALTEGFSATVFADEIGVARHMAVAENGWVYVALYRPKDGFGGVALKDSDGDGEADEAHYFGEGLTGTGIELQGDYLYYGADQEILRYDLSESPLPGAEAQTIVSGFPAQRAHAAKPLAFDGAGYLYVNIGVPSNACMVEIRQKGSPGQDPCPELENHGGIWRFKADQPGQDFKKDGYRYSTGHRNAVGIDWNPYADALYLMQHGRDQLGSFFPDYYSEADSAELPAEEFHKVEEGADLGFPYSYYDHRKGARMKMPEYGGDGQITSDIGQMPLVGFPGHWAPNDVFFPRRATLPASMKYGAFIAFHGSWNRAPFPQAGYRVAFVPMNEAGDVTGDWITFADGFSGDPELRSPTKAKYRPMGLADDTKGALYISSTAGGRIWRVTYNGE